MHTSGERALCHDAPQTILALVSETTGDYRQVHGPSGCRPRVFSLPLLARVSTRAPSGQSTAGQGSPVESQASWKKSG